MESGGHLRSVRQRQVEVQAAISESQLGSWVARDSFSMDCGRAGPSTAAAAATLE